IAWPKEGEQHYLKRVQEDFAASLRAHKLHDVYEKSRCPAFVEPLLSRRRMAARAPGRSEQETKRGTWSELVTAYPQVGVLIGGTNSGRSLLLRWIVADLASRGEPHEGGDLPVYLSVSRFPFEDARGMLDAAAFACGQQPETMRDCWYNAKRRVLFAI